MKHRTFLGFRLHRGEPDRPTKLRAYTGSMLLRDAGPDGLNNYADHAIARWYGVSFRLRWFMGFWLLGKTTYPTERGPIPQPTSKAPATPDIRT